MTFKSVAELEQYILSKMQSAIIKAQEQIYQVIDRFVKEYYAEYTPEVYERTYQLYRSLVKSEIIHTGKGYKANVYFDLTNLDYQVKRLTKWKDEYGYRNPFNNAYSPNGIFLNPKGSAEKVMQSAAHGSHGGYKNGTAIWDESIAVLNTEAYEILKRMLKESGVPVK